LKPLNPGQTADQRKEAMVILSKEGASVITGTRTLDSLAGIVI